MCIPSKCTLGSLETAFQPLYNYKSLLKAKLMTFLLDLEALQGGECRVSSQDLHTSDGE